MSSLCSAFRSATTRSDHGPGPKQNSRFFGGARLDDHGYEVVLAPAQESAVVPIRQQNGDVANRARGGQIAVYVKGPETVVSPRKICTLATTDVWLPMAAVPQARRSPSSSRGLLTETTNGPEGPLTVREVGLP
jgi:hypothetical protein